MKETLIKWLLDIKREITAEQIAQGKRASGFSANSLEPEATDKKGVMYGTSLFRFQEVGRRPGKLPPIQAIMEWIRIKQLSLNPWAVRASIGKRGTRLHRGEERPLGIDRILEEKLPELQNMLADKGAKKLADDIVKRMNI